VRSVSQSFADEHGEPLVEILHNRKPDHPGARPLAEVKVGENYDGTVVHNKHGVFVDFGFERNAKLQVKSKYKPGFSRGMRVQGMTCTMVDTSRGWVSMVPNPWTLPAPASRSQQRGRSKSRCHSTSHYVGGKGRGKSGRPFHYQGTPSCPRAGSVSPRSISADAARRDAPVDDQGRPIDLQRVIVNFINVGTTYGKQVLKRFDIEGSNPSFHWQGVRLCVKHLHDKCFMNVIGVIFQDWRGCDGDVLQPDLVVGIPPDIRIMCEHVEETPRICGSHQKDADDEMTIKMAQRRNCRIMDNDNYRDWAKHHPDPEIRCWLKHSRPRVQMNYYFDMLLGTFETLDGKVSAVGDSSNASRASSVEQVPQATLAESVESPLPSCSHRKGSMKGKIGGSEPTSCLPSPYSEDLHLRGKSSFKGHMVRSNSRCKGGQCDSGGTGGQGRQCVKDWNYGNDVADGKNWASGKGGKRGKRSGSTHYSKGPRVTSRNRRSAENCTPPFDPWC